MSIGATSIRFFKNTCSHVQKKESRRTRNDRSRTSRGHARSESCVVRYGTYSRPASYEHDHATSRSISDDRNHDHTQNCGHSFFVVFVTCPPTPTVTSPTVTMPVTPTAPPVAPVTTSTMAATPPPLTPSRPLAKGGCSRKLQANADPSKTWTVERRQGQSSSEATNK